MRRSIVVLALVIAAGRAHAQPHVEARNCSVASGGSIIVMPGANLNVCPAPPRQVTRGAVLHHHPPKTECPVGQYQTKPGGRCCEFGQTDQGDHCCPIGQEWGGSFCQPMTREEKCDADDADACFELAKSSVDAFDDAGARAYAAKACAKDHVLACGIEGRVEIAADDQTAWPQACVRMKRACTAGDPAACGTLGAAMLAERCPATDEAGKLLAGACTSGQPRFCTEIAAELARSGNADRLGMSVDDALHLAGSGCNATTRDADACFTLGSALDKIDRADAAFTALDQACSYGQASACAYAALELDKSGHGDDEQAFAYNQRACSLGESTGCTSVGMFYEYGKVVQLDLAKAAEYDDKSCAMNDWYGCSTAGNVYEKKDDFDTAHARYQKLCAMGEDLGCTEDVLLDMRWALRDDREPTIDTARLRSYCAKDDRVCEMLDAYQHRDDVSVLDHSSSGVAAAEVRTSAGGPVAGFAAGLTWRWVEFVDHVEFGSQFHNELDLGARLISLPSPARSYRSFVDLSVGGYVQNTGSYSGDPKGTVMGGVYVSDTLWLSCWVSARIQAIVPVSLAKDDFAVLVGIGVAMRRPQSIYYDPCL